MTQAAVPEGNNSPAVTPPATGVNPELVAVERLRVAREALFQQMHKVIIGQSEVLDALLTAIFCRGHCLLVGVPGLAKTLMISTLARVLDLRFNRIQFTPDLMPSDITGTDIIQEDPETGQRVFTFVRGPIFTNLLLADEINRTPPKTQAALLQAMQEYQVTAGGKTYSLEPPFFVLATQNPVEQEGTYPLTEAQLDRFMFMVKVGYPEHDEEKLIVKATTSEYVGDPQPVLSDVDVIAIQRMVRRVPVSEHVVDYAVNLARATRPGEKDAPEFVHQLLTWGAGPRAAQYLVLAAKARAILRGRLNVSVDDIKQVAKPVLRHRLILNFNAEAEGVSADSLIERLLATVPESGPEYYQQKTP